MLINDAEQKVQVRSLVLWQIGAVVAASGIAFVLLLDGLSVFVGGCLAMLATWHVHRSVCVAGVDKGRLLKLAGIRFVLFLIALAVGIYFFALQPVFLIAGVAIAYIAMYISSLMKSFKYMKGDGLG